MAFAGTPHQSKSPPLHAWRICIGSPGKSTLLVYGREDVKTTTLNRLLVTFNVDCVATQTELKVHHRLDYVSFHDKERQQTSIIAFRPNTLGFSLLPDPHVTVIRHAIYAIGFPFKYQQLTCIQVSQQTSGARIKQLCPAVYHGSIPIPFHTPIHDRIAIATIPRLFTNTLSVDSLMPTHPLSVSMSLVCAQFPAWYTTLMTLSDLRGWLYLVWWSENARLCAFKSIKTSGLPCDPPRFERYGTFVKKIIDGRDPEVREETPTTSYLRVWCALVHRGGGSLLQLMMKTLTELMEAKQPESVLVHHERVWKESVDFLLELAKWIQRTKAIYKQELRVLRQITPRIPWPHSGGVLRELVAQGWEWRPTLLQHDRMICVRCHHEKSGWWCWSSPLCGCAIC